VLLVGFKLQLSALSATATAVGILIGS
jgi:hypothetical protein